MDAQNAVESANTKQAASPKRGVAESDDPRSTVTANSTTTNNIKPPITAKPSSISRDTKDSRPAATLPSTQDDDVGLDQNSDAETIVLPGKDGVSPSKPRKMIKHEDNSDGEINDVLLPPRKHSKDDKDGGRIAGPHDNAATSLERRKRPFGKEKQPRNKDASSGLSSAPASPPPHRRNNPDQTHRRHKSGDAHSESGSESSKSKSSKDLIKNNAKSVDRLLPSKRKAPKAESDDEGESRKIRRPRISDTSLENSIGVRERDQKSSSGRLPQDKHSASRNRSLSPHGRIHRRSLSTQLPSQSSNGFSTKKRRPPPLQAADYHSDDSSASGSPHPRSSKLRSIATPVTGESTVSPARVPPHKKHVDNHGQTLLAKACAKGEYDVAKKRLTERPEDLNFADYAGNTPLQVASLNGHEQIVQLLIDAGCNLDCRNSDKETPLLDAVENGHLGVVKLLLKAGVNPRKADAEGHEPLEKVPDDLENAEEIRAALREAKEKVGELRRTSEDHHDLPDTVSSHGPESPRRSPPAPGSSSALAAQRRGGAVRSTKTSNHLLYMNLDDKTLRQAAARGDNETVTRVLQVKERCDDPEALVNAARGGHSFVVELLLALGGANPDPRPVSGLPTDYGTPMLAAIGGENIDVIKLLLNASNFDPTRRFKGQTYYEIARNREGPMWKEEEHLLKNAYDEFKKGSKGSKTKSPGRRERDRELDQETRRTNRKEANLEANRVHKRRPSSPARDTDSKKKTVPAKISGSPKEKRRSLSLGNPDEQTSPKRGPGRPKKEDRVTSITTSDREVSPTVSKSQPAKSKLVDSDLANGSSDTETVKPRRKLISGKDLKGHREKQRRASMASNNSAPERGDARNDDAPDKRLDRLSERYHDRTKAIKRDESNDRLSMAEGSAKRPRSSVTPPRHGLGDKDDADAPIKRRKLDPDSKEKRSLQNSSPESRLQKREVSRDSAKRHRLPETDRKEGSKAKKANRERRDLDKASPLEKSSITVASEDVDVDMRDAPQTHSAEESEAQLERERKEAKRRQAEAEAIAAEELKKKEAERQRQEAEKKKQEEEAAAAAAEAKRQEEAEKKRLEEEERSRREREEKKRKEEEEKARLEEERKQREEQERKLREEEERKRKEEEERKRKEEEEARIRREREAAEEAQRVREQEERERERKRVEKARREAAREAEVQRIRQEEMERLRLSKLPPLLRWLDGCPDPKQREIAELFATARGVRYDTINPSATGKADGREQWLLNTQVALLLGEKDTSLSRYTAWERIPVSRIAKRVIWRLEQDRYALTEGKLYHLGEQLPDYYGCDPHSLSYTKLEQLRGKAAERFLETDMFFVKESDFLYIVPTIPHLRNVKLSIWYCELPENEAALATFSAPPAKWKQDPDAESRGRWAPRAKYYINGELVGEDKPKQYRPSKIPFPEHRVPRRGGLVAVTPDDPEYAHLCVEQGLTHLLTDQQKHAVLNGAHLTPRSMVSNEALEYNVSPSESPNAPQVNGIKNVQESLDNPPVNGVSEDE